MTPSAIATTTAASATSVAAASAPVNCRKTIAAATTSVTPIPIREMTAGRDSRGRPRASGSGGGAGGGHRRCVAGVAAQPDGLAPVQPRRARAAARLAPDQRAAGGDEHERPGQRVGERQPERAERQQDRDEQEADAEPDLERGAAVAPACAARRSGAACSSLPSAGHEHPRQHVGDEPEAAGERRRGEGDPQQQRIDVEPPAEALADAGHHAVARVAAQLAQRRRPLASGSRPCGAARDHPRRDSPLASRTAPTTANAIGAIAPKFSRSVPLRSSSSTMPNATSASPATSDSGSKPRARAHHAADRAGALLPLRASRVSRSHGGPLWRVPS